MRLYLPVIRQTSVRRFATAAGAALADPRPAPWHNRLQEAVVKLTNMRREHSPAGGAWRLLAHVYPTFEGLVESYIADGFEDCSDLRYDARLARQVVSEYDFHELLKDHPHNVHEYMIRRHMKRIMKTYVRLVDDRRAIRVRDGEKFLTQMMRLGMTVKATAPCLHGGKVKVEWVDWDAVRDVVAISSVSTLAGLVLIGLVYPIFRR